MPSPVDHAEIDALVSAINNDWQQCRNGAASSNQALPQLRYNLRKLTWALEDPYANFWRIVRSSALLSPVKIAQDIGIFQILENRTSPITAIELAKQTHAAEELIVRILRPLCAEGLVSEVSEQSYMPTACGKPFASPHHVDAISFALHFLPIAMSNPSFFASTNYQEPTSITPFAAYFQKPNYRIFDFLAENPSVSALFASSMAAGLDRKVLASTVYPYGKELENCSEGDVVLVDVGGNKGSTICDIAAKSPEIKGRWILQDLPEVVGAKGELPGNIEVMAHDIFTEQPVKGAYAFHLKRILHDWSDEKCRIILSHIVDAMDPNHSRVLIMDIVLPNTNATFLQSMSDHSMMTFGGKERSERQWRELVGSVGLKVKRIWKGEDAEGVLECWRM